MIRTKLISATENIELQIVYCARVSSPSSQAAEVGNDRLLAYLIRHKHWSPFEMATMTIEITCPRDISRQVIRHRSFSFQEHSGRYANMDKTPFIRECRMQAETNRQSSVHTDDEKLKIWWREAQEIIWDTCLDTYHDALDRGIAREQARALLPEGMAMSRLYMSGTIRSWIHYIQVRDTEHAQAEHREIARQAKKILADIAPTVTRALETP